MVKIGRDVDELLGLILDGFHHLWVAVTGGGDRNAGGKIQETIAIDIPHFAAATVIHHKWITTRVRGGDNGLISFDEAPGFWSWNVEGPHTQCS